MLVSVEQSAWLNNPEDSVKSISLSLDSVLRSSLPDETDAVHYGRNCSAKYADCCKIFLQKC